MTMQLFCDKFLSCVIGKNEWKNQIRIKPITEIATISDEAFALLILENIWDDWITMNANDYIK